MKEKAMLLAATVCWSGNVIAQAAERSRVECRLK